MKQCYRSNRMLNYNFVGNWCFVQFLTVRTTIANVCTFLVTSCQQTLYKYVIEHPKSQMDARLYSQSKGANYYTAIV
jgi:hypothetical protein